MRPLVRLVISTVTASIGSRPSGASGATAAGIGPESSPGSVDLGSDPATDGVSALGDSFTARLRAVNDALRAAQGELTVAQVAEAALAEARSLLETLGDLAREAALDTTTDERRSAIQADADEALASLDALAAASLTDSASAGALGSGGDRRVEVRATRDTFAVVTPATLAPPSQGLEEGAPRAAPATEAVGAGGLAFGDLVINHLDAGSTGDEADAPAKAAAVESEAFLHEVRARAGATAVAGAAAVAPEFLDAGDLLINGVDVGPVGVAFGDADGALLLAIEAVSGETGVTGAVGDDGVLTLTAPDGRDVVLTVSAAGQAVTGLTPGTTRAALEVRSSVDVAVRGEAPEKAGLAAGTSGAIGQAARMLEGLDVTTAAAATEAGRGIDAAADLLDAHATGLVERLRGLESGIRNLERALVARAAPLGDYTPAMASLSVDSIRRAVSTDPRRALIAQAGVAPQIALTLLA